MPEPTTDQMRETTHLRDDTISPAAYARNEWMKLEKTQEHMDPSTLQAPAHMRQYLENRLELAFVAGWEARKKWERGA